MKRIVHPILLSLFLLCAAPHVYATTYCTQPSNTGDETLSSSCTFSPTVEGTQNGNLNVASGVTLTITAGQTIMWNPGYSLNFSPGAQLFVASTGVVKKGDICLVDADNDGYPSNPSHSVETAGPCTGNNHPRKNMTILNTTPNATDCNDSNGGLGIAATCYPDADSDGVFSPNSVSVCAASCAGPNYSATPGTDCNDGNANVWISHVWCYADLDKDTYTNGHASNTTCLNSSSCNTATYASASTDGAAVTSYTAGQLKDAANGTDCCDADANANTAGTYQTSQDACTSWDWDCSGNASGDKEWGVVGAVTTCTPNAGSCQTVTSGSVGWVTSVPACGVSGTYVSTPGTCASGPYPGCAPPADSVSGAQTQACK